VAESASPDGEVVVGVFGQITDAKRIDIAAAAVARLVARGVSCKLRLVGAEGDRDGSRTRSGAAAASILDAARAQLGQRLEVLTRTESPLVEMARCTVVVNPNPLEPLGRTLIEAQAVGVPVVAMEGAGSTETLVEGITGTIARPANELGLADAIEAVLEAKAGGRMNPEFARAWAQTHFSPDRIGDLYWKSLEEALL